MFTRIAWLAFIVVATAVTSSVVTAVWVTPNTPRGAEPPPPVPVPAAPAVRPAPPRAAAPVAPDLDLPRDCVEVSALYLLIEERSANELARRWWEGHVVGRLEEIKVVQAGQVMVILADRHGATGRVALYEETAKFRDALKTLRKGDLILVAGRAVELDSARPETVIVNAVAIKRPS